MAGNPAYTELLIGLGIRSFSVVPGELLEVKRVIRTVSTARAHDVAACVLSARTISAVKTCLAARAQEVEAAAAAKSRRNVKGPAEAAWENEGGHILTNMKTILTALDFSDSEKRVIEMAVTLARSVQAHVAFLHVIQPVSGTASEYGFLEASDKIARAAVLDAVYRLAHIQRRLSSE